MQWFNANVKLVSDRPQGPPQTDIRLPSGRPETREQMAVCDTTLKIILHKPCRQQISSGDQDP